MAIPPDRAPTGRAKPAWATLSAEDKRKRLLGTADALFAAEGFDVPMPVIAAAAGAGIGSLYRQFAHKDDLIAALVVERLAAMRVEVDAALEQDDAWPALVAAIRRLIAVKGSDRVMRQAMATTSGRPDVEDARRRLAQAFEVLLDRAKAEGALRKDATVLDVRLVFAAVAVADDVEPGASARQLDLLLAGLAAQPGRC
jgi:AcrR family transcriptional regulator